MRVAAGAIARKYLRERLGVQHQRLSERRSARSRIEPVKLEAVYDNPFFCPDPSRVAGARRLHVEAARRGRLGRRAASRYRARRAAGLGEPVFDRLDADIAHAMMGINAVKGVEIGEGFAASRRRAASIATR